MVLAAVLLSFLFSIPAQGQSRSVMQDPVRGVTFHSIELSDDRINDLRVVEGDFTESDRLAIGFSAAVLKGSTEPYRYVLWIRHEGRRWLDTESSSPLELIVDGEPLPLMFLRTPQPFVGPGGLFYELIEREVTATNLERLIAASDTFVRFRANSGHVEKVISREELLRVEEFLASF
jgi:hypothetical protein